MVNSKSKNSMLKKVLSLNNPGGFFFPSGFWKKNPVSQSLSMKNPSGFFFPGGLWKKYACIKDIKYAWILKKIRVQAYYARIFSNPWPFRLESAWIPGGFRLEFSYGSWKNFSKKLILKKISRRQNAFKTRTHSMAPHRKSPTPRSRRYLMVFDPLTPSQGHQHPQVPNPGAWPRQPNKKSHLLYFIFFICKKTHKVWFKNLWNWLCNWDFNDIWHFDPSPKPQETGTQKIVPLHVPFM